MESLFLLSNQQIKTILGERIKRFRIEKGMSQKDLSDRTGVSVHSLSNVENGKDFNVDILLHILKGLNIVNNLNLLVPETVTNPYDIAKGIEVRQRRKRT